MYVNNHDFKGDCAVRGKYAENEFVKAALARNYKLRDATLQEQYLHIDYILKGLHPVSKKEITVTVDVKARKKSNRKNARVDDKWVWLEMANVQGKLGWVYGKANFIAFERAADFVVIKRESLCHWAESSGKIRYDLPYVTQTWKAKYRVYSRLGRKDQITLVKMDDILKLEGCYIWRKENA